MVDFLQNPEIGKIVSEEVVFASPNMEMVNLLRLSVRENRSIYPTQEDLRRVNSRKIREKLF